ncbi:hypothetical protein WJX72_005058 [[Myrmecia] bisecta]|uniref:Uncharacterized protein n=1 Tax=[Myrmecia] bisecta TaxID=41462 RepID=A0AAW1QAP8_9CHLO
MAVQSLQHVLDVLSGTTRCPVSNFVSFTGELSTQQLLLLATALQANQQLAGLRLKGCKLDDDAAKILGSAVSSNLTLTTFELPGNNIGPIGAEHLAAALEKNPIITALDLSGNPCENDATKAMQSINSSLHRNRLQSRMNAKSTPTPVRRASLRTPQPAKTLSIDPTSVGKGVSIEEVAPDTPLGVYRTPEPVTATKRTPGIPKGRPHVLSARHTNENSNGAASDAIELEYRLQQLESCQGALGSEVEAMRGLGSQLEAWKLQMDSASTQVASVLNLVEKDATHFKAQFDDLQAWRSSVDALNLHLADGAKAPIPSLEEEEAAEMAGHSVQSGEAQFASPVRAQARASLHAHPLSPYQSSTHTSVEGDVSWWQNEQFRGRTPALTQTASPLRPRLPAKLPSQSLSGMTDVLEASSPDKQPSGLFKADSQPDGQLSGMSEVLEGVQLREQLLAEAGGADAFGVRVREPLAAQDTVKEALEREAQRRDKMEAQLQELRQIIPRLQVEMLGMKRMLAERQSLPLPSARRTSGHPIAQLHDPNPSHQTPSTVNNPTAADSIDAFPGNLTRRISALAAALQGTPRLHHSHAAISRNPPFSESQEPVQETPIRLARQCPLRHNQRQC